MSQAPVAGIGLVAVGDTKGPLKVIEKRAFVVVLKVIWMQR
jgi:hypothetical protein